MTPFVDHPHEWDLPSQYCKRCGMASLSYVQDGGSCLPADAPVSAIAHLRARRVMAKLLGPIAAWL